MIVAPLSVPLTKSKNWILNLNSYRNTHYQSLNKTKINYKEELKAQIEALPVYSKVSITYTLFVKTKRLCDVGNVLSIHDKYFQDALVECGKLPDDNYQHVPEIVFLFGGQDKENPRVEIEIKEI